MSHENRGCLDLRDSLFFGCGVDGKRMEHVQAIEDSNPFLFVHSQSLKFLRCLETHRGFADRMHKCQLGGMKK